MSGEHIVILTLHLFEKGTFQLFFSPKYKILNYYILNYTTVHLFLSQFWKKNLHFGFTPFTY